MNSHRPHIRILISLLLGLLPTPYASAEESGILNRIQSGIDEVTEGINYVGRKAEEIIGTGREKGNQLLAGNFQETRSVELEYPVGLNPTVALTHEFGAINIQTWAENIVQVNAEILVGAEKKEIAAEVATSIVVSVAHSKDLVEIRTVLPDTRKEIGPVTKIVNYTITVPRNASIIANNFFGDTAINNIKGDVTLDSQYGIVNLQNLEGGLSVRAHGESLQATNLKKGGIFHLSGTQATFTAISGNLEINNFRGDIKLRDTMPGARIDAVSDSGTIELEMDANEPADITTMALFGEIYSNIPLQRSSQGDYTIARSPHPDVQKRFMLRTSFGTIRISALKLEDSNNPNTLTGTKPFSEPLVRSEPAPPGTTLTIDAMVGDIRLEGTDDNHIRITANRVVWVSTAAEASPALEALDVQVLQDGDNITINTLLKDSTVDLGATTYRLDLNIECPRTIPIQIRARDGNTFVNSIGGDLEITQAKGAINAQNTWGNLTLSNLQGDINVHTANGTIQADTRHGNLTLTDCKDVINANNIEGQTIIEAPQGPVTIRNTGGDVRLLALKPIGGDFDILVKGGHLSMLLTQESNATLYLNSQDGIVHTSIPLTGSILGTQREFQGRLNDGQHTVRLEVHDGDIILDGPTHAKVDVIEVLQPLTQLQPATP